MSNVSHPVFGYCPYLDNEYSIAVEYAVITRLGQPTEYKPLRSNCDESESCPYGNRCPIYEYELATNT
jgi:hypothetical protein